MTLRRAGLAAVCALAFACATPWDPPGLRPHAGVLAAHPGQRLFDATPYLLPIGGELVAFFCRWDTAEPLSVAIPADVTPHERRALEAALSAWEAAGLGIRFRVAAPGEAGAADVAFEFLAPERTRRAEGTGYTLADCRVGGLPAAASQPRLDARLARARIRIVRREVDEWDEQDHAWFAAEVAGVALHELAHALGFQGHARFGGGLLAPDTRESTRVGRAVLAGAGLSEPTLRALYALPSGVVLERTPVPPVRTESVDASLAVFAGEDGPYVRVGDRSGRVCWRLPDGRPWGLTLTSIDTARRRPERLVLLPDPVPADRPLR